MSGIPGHNNEGYHYVNNVVADIVTAGIIGLEGAAVYFGILPNLGNAVFIPAGVRTLQAGYNAFTGSPKTALTQLGEAALLAGAGAAYRMS